MLIARYRPADAIRWIEIGTRRIAKPGDLPFDPPGDAKAAVIEALRKAFNLGKSKVAELQGKAIRAREYLLYEDRFEAVLPTGMRTIHYADVQSLEVRRAGGFVLRLRKGRLTLKPYAWLSVPGARVPLGWERNGVEVPFETLPEEIALRADVRVGTSRPER